MSRLGDILVLGLGSSGTAAVRYCCSLLGTEVDSVTAIDASDSAAVQARAAELTALGARVILGSAAVSGRFDLGIVSPGIPLHASILTSAQNACRRIVSEIEFAFQRSSEPWVAVTGTNGKTTTTALVAHLLNHAGIPASAVGNIGTPAIQEVGAGGGASVLVAEVSSFQLALTDTFRPRVAVLLNITPDHIDWHGSYERYVSDKARVFANMGEDDVAVIDTDDPGSAPFADLVERSGVSVIRVSRHGSGEGTAAVSEGVLTLHTAKGRVPLVDIDELAIRGAHNVSNALAAAAAAHALGAGTAELRDGLRAFRPIEHRLEPVGEVGGVEWFNDSKATNPDAVFKAVAAFDDRPLIVLMGGRNKGNDFRPLAKFVAGRAREIVVFGESGEEMETAFLEASTRVTRVDGMADAVATAASLAHPGDAVVLSPACASFDEFANYEERGRIFRALVASLPGGEA